MIFFSIWENGLLFGKMGGAGVGKFPLKDLKLASLRNSDKINHQFVSSSLSFRRGFARRNLLNSFIKSLIINNSGDFSSKTPFDKLRAGSFDKLRAGSFDKLRVGSFDKLRASCRNDTSWQKMKLIVYFVTIPKHFPQVVSINYFSSSKNDSYIENLMGIGV